MNKFTTWTFLCFLQHLFTTKENSIDTVQLKFQILGYKIIDGEILDSKEVDQFFKQIE